VQGSKERSNKSDDVIRCTTRSDTNSQVSEASEVESHSRKSDSGQNCKVSEASEHEVKSRSSDSGETLSAPSELSRDQHQKQDSKILQKHKYSDYGFANHEEVTFKSSKDFQIDFLNRERDVNLHFQERRYYLW
jgi:hypothetical protein